MMQVETGEEGRKRWTQTAARSSAGPVARLSHEKHKHPRSERDLLEEILLLARRAAEGGRTAAGYWSNNLLGMHTHTGPRTKHVALRIGLPNPRQDNWMPFVQMY